MDGNVKAGRIRADEIHGGREDGHWQGSSTLCYQASHSKDSRGFEEGEEDTWLWV